MQPPMPLTKNYEDIPLGWCYMPGDDLPFYLRQALPAGGYMLGRDRIGPAVDFHSGQGLRRMPMWFPAGDRAGHVAQLVMILVLMAEQRGACLFTTRVRGTKVDGVTLLYNSGMYKYPTIEGFAQALDNYYTDPVFNNDHSKSLATIIEERDLQRQLHTLVTTPQPFPQLPQVDINVLRQQGAALYEVGKNADYQEYDQPWCMVDAGIWTDHMGPCITVGLTATSAGKRYNALLHSFRDFTGAQIIDSLLNFFDGQEVPQYNALGNVAWFVVGGSPDYTSLDKAVQLATELRTRNLPLLGVQFTADPGDLGRSKAVLITATGQVSWAYQ